MATCEKVVAVLKNQPVEVRKILVKLLNTFLRCSWIQWNAAAIDEFYTAVSSLATYRVHNTVWAENLFGLRSFKLLQASRNANLEPTHVLVPAIVSKNYACFTAVERIWLRQVFCAEVNCSSHSFA